MNTTADPVVVDHLTVRYGRTTAVDDVSFKIDSGQVYALLGRNGVGKSTLLAAIAGSCVGFLRYNFQPATIYMGDTGSQFLGFVIAVLAVALTQSVNTALNPLLPLFLVGLPIIDTFMVMYKRIRAGRSPFSADKNHMHHQLLALGMQHYEAVSFIYLTQILFVVCGVLLRYESDLLVGAVYLLLCGSVVALMRFATSHDWKLKGSYVTDLVSRVDRHPGVALDGRLHGRSGRPRSAMSARPAGLHGPFRRGLPGRSHATLLAAPRRSGA